MRRIGLVFAAALPALAASCGSATAEAPLTVQLGITHDATEHALHAHQFCREPGQLDSNQELFPRCERTASEISDAWVTAIFDGDKLVELRRWERFADDNRAVERWNELVAARAKASTPADDALAQLHVLQPGTRSVKAFRGDGDTLIGVYLLTPTPPEQASVLEKISYIKR